MYVIITDVTRLAPRACTQSKRGIVIASFYGMRWPSGKVAELFEAGQDMSLAMTKRGWICWVFARAPQADVRLMVKKKLDLGR